MKKIFMYLCIPLLVLGMASCDKDKEPAGPEGDGTEQTPGTETPGTDAPSGEVQPDGITYYYVNLGLPSGLLWASANVGSEKPAAPGKYISWGETKPKTEYWTDKWYNDDLGVTKYCTNESDGEVDNLTRLEQADDAASANMGGKWRMPTAEEFEELLENCSYIETTLDGYEVIVFESKINDNRLVFPITHIKEYDDINMEGYVSCWSSDVDLTENFNAQILLCGYDEYGMDIINRSRGLQVRGVLDAEYENTATMLPESEYPVLPEDEGGEDEGGEDEGGEISELVPTKPTEMENSRYYVDLGLSVKWAYANYGTNNSPSQLGLYVAWGAFREKEESTWENYPYGDATNGKLDKYCEDEEYGKVDNLTILEKADDAPATSWGGNWRMPTASEFEELLTQCSWEFGTLNDTEGYLVTGPNGNSIFLPVTHNTAGFYWTSELVPEHSDLAKIAVFYDEDRLVTSQERISQYVIRPVLP